MLADPDSFGHPASAESAVRFWCGDPKTPGLLRLPELPSRFSIFRANQPVSEMAVPGGVFPATWA